MISAERSTHSMGLTLSWTTVLISVLSKQWVAVRTTWRCTSSRGSVPGRDSASRRSMAAFLSTFEGME
eukprot:CAMPEP_0174289470 /NCGR_PEP_ID=MMETSP0809-20121228/25154_1 /TAXON_ID=73025 ORGANISM="Eutreptiella gymnastica-like, Strain CCMP1594" /NCGR_SAMPLE_ID=MMETSP0809 /ASSEMBLY_ACC=CAM_ASM_000658 /LENGTH=67 /DNA_ID=CAMNT_0015387443 /DNA_START=489 /DNA_END=692 /DNA_ORIENTATION=-